MYVCMYVCMAALGLRCCTQAFSVTASGGYSSLCCVDYSLRWLLLLQSTGSRCTGFSSCGTRASVVVHRLSSCGLRTLERRLSRCGARAQLLSSMWDLPGPGLEPVSSALAGRFLTSAPPGIVLHKNLKWFRDLNVKSKTIKLFFGWRGGGLLLLLFFGCAAQLMGSQFPNQGSNLIPQQWKHRVLTTGLPGKSLKL